MVEPALQGGVTTYVYTATGQLASIMDAEGQVTSYTYNARNEKTVETYPDHTGGNPGDAGYGKIQFAYDPAGRLELPRFQCRQTVNRIEGLVVVNALAFREQKNGPDG